MLMGQILLRLHLKKARLCPLEFKTQSITLVQGINRHISRNNQFYPAIIYLVYEANETLGLIPSLVVKARNSTENQGMK